MYINPFIFGVLSTIFAAMAALIIYAIYSYGRKK